MAKEQEMVFIVFIAEPDGKPIRYRKDFWEDPARQKYLGIYKLCKNTAQIERYYSHLLKPVKKVKKETIEPSKEDSKVDSTVDNKAEKK